MKKCPVILYRKVKELGSLDGWSQYKDIDGYLEMTSAKVKTYKSNPYLENGTEDVVQVIATLDDVVIGGQTPFALPIMVDGERIVSCGATRLWVNPQYRKTGIALDIIEEAIKIPSGRVCVNAGLSFQARKIYAMMGYCVYPLAQFGYIRKADSFVEHHFSKGVRGIVSLLVNLLFGVQRLFLQMLAYVKTRAFSIEVVPFEDENSLEAFSGMVAADRHRFRADIDSRWFKWVSANDFNDVTKADYCLYGIRRNGQLIGFFFTRRSSGGKEGRILEWQVAEPFVKSEGWLMLRIAALLCRNGVHHVTLSVPDGGAAASLFSSLRIRGFIPQVVAVAPAEDSPLRSHKGYDDPVNWRLRPSMGDAAFY